MAPISDIPNLSLRDNKYESETRKLSAGVKLQGSVRLFPRRSSSGVPLLFSGDRAFGEIWQHQNDLVWPPKWTARGKTFVRPTDENCTCLLTVLFQKSLWPLQNYRIPHVRTWKVQMFHLNSPPSGSPPKLGGNSRHFPNFTFSHYLERQGKNSGNSESVDLFLCHNTFFSQISLFLWSDTLIHFGPLWPPSPKRHIPLLWGPPKWGEYLYAPPGENIICKNSTSMGCIQIQYWNPDIVILNLDGRFCVANMPIFGYFGPYRVLVPPNDRQWKFFSYFHHWYHCCFTPAFLALYQLHCGRYLTLPIFSPYHADFFLVNVVRLNLGGVLRP